MLEKILQEINELSEEHPYKIQGKHETYSQYNEAWQDCISRVEGIIEKNISEKNDGWILVEERLPDKEADKFIKEKLDGIGYLYPCLLTYRSPNTERIHVVRFYYDVYERWFVNAGEELCDKDRCIAWQPLPEPYRLKRSEK